jgi:hypothetical protein
MGAAVKKSQRPFSPQMLKELFRLEPSLHQGGGPPFGPVVMVDLPRLQLVQDHIGHDRPLALAEGFPVVPCADHRFSIVAG